MVDFSKMLEGVFDLDVEPVKDEISAERLRKIEDQEFFADKKMHEVQLTMSMERAGSRSNGDNVQRATFIGKDGQPESVNVIFQGSRAKELENGQLMSELENERQGRLAQGDFSAPERALDVIGAWTSRSWTDRDGKSHQKRELLAAKWSFVADNGSRVIEGTMPEGTAATKQEERDAAVRAMARRRTEKASGSRSASLDHGEIDF